MEIEFTGIEFESGIAAVEYAEAGGGRAVLVGGTHYVVSQREAERLEMAGVEFAYLGWVETDYGPRICTVPIN